MDNLDFQYESLSLGEGREIEPQGVCLDSWDGRHHYVAISCIQSNEHFVCKSCGDEYWD